PAQRSRLSLTEGQREFVSLLTSNPMTVAAAAVLAVLAIVAIFAYQIAPHPGDATGDTHLAARLLAPSWQHLFRTDELGRDVFSRVLIGARTSLVSGMIPILIAAAIGMPAGAIAGYYGGWIDTGIMRGADVLISLPRLVLAIALGAALGPSLRN